MRWFLFEIPALSIENKSQDHWAFIYSFISVSLFFHHYLTFISLVDHKNSEVKRN